MQYRHTQLGAAAIAAMGFVLLFIVGRYSADGSLQLGEVGGLVILLLLLRVFSLLTVEVKNDNLSCYFAGGFIRKTFPLSEINDAHAVRNPWFSGWGIRWMPGRYWLWNVGGYRAVELQLKNGKRFRIGTNEPESLVQAIQTSKAAGALTSRSIRL